MNASKSTWRMPKKSRWRFHRVELTSGRRSLPWKMSPKLICSIYLLSLNVTSKRTKCLKDVHMRATQKWIHTLTPLGLTTELSAEVNGWILTTNKSWCWVLLRTFICLETTVINQWTQIVYAKWGSEFVSHMPLRPLGHHAHPYLHSLPRQFAIFFGIAALWLWS